MGSSEFQVNKYIDAIHEILKCIDDKNYVEVNLLISTSLSTLSVKKSRLDDESQKNQLFLYEQVFKFLESNSHYWNSIINDEFSESWNKLQDCLDYIRRIKKFSSTENLLISFFEKQLVALEETYPYTLFSSVGMVVDMYKCSLCGLDIDSLDCPHMVGELYAGEIAYGIAQGEGSYLDHVAITENPQDKRCVLNSFENNSYQFAVQRQLAEYIKDDKMKPLDFHEVSKIYYKMGNPDYKKLNRNASCFCGSDKKFKSCCINKQTVDAVHFEFIRNKNLPNKAFKSDLRRLADSIQSLVV